MNAIPCSRKFSQEIEEINTYDTICSTSVIEAKIEKLVRKNNRKDKKKLKKFKEI